MTERVRVRFARNRDPRTDYYNIYRSADPDVGRYSSLIMKVQQPLKATALRKQEALVAEKPGVYPLSNTHIVLEEDFFVYKSGVLIDEVHYQVDAGRGILFLSKPTEEPVSVLYHFDGIEVIDDPEQNPHEQVQYYGPALTNRKALLPLNNVSILPTAEGMRIDYQLPETDGSDFYYAIESVSLDGSRSTLSDPIHLHLNEGITGIVMERLVDGRDWEALEFQPDSLYLVDQRADTEPPEGLEGFEYVTSVEAEEVYATFTWSTPLKNEITGLSPKYRVRVRGLSGELSEPSHIAGPERIKSEIDKVVIYERSGLSGPPTYGAADALKVAEIAAGETGSYRHKMKKNGSFAYSLFVVDQSGNHSLASTAIITT